MAVVAMKQLLEAGVHFGHQTRRWDPKMAEYIYSKLEMVFTSSIYKKLLKKLTKHMHSLKNKLKKGKQFYS